MVENHDYSHPEAYRRRRNIFFCSWNLQDAYYKFIDICRTRVLLQWKPIFRYPFFYFFKEFYYYIPLHKNGCFPWGTNANSFGSITWQASWHNCFMPVFSYQFFFNLFGYFISSVWLNSFNQFSCYQSKWLNTICMSSKDFFENYEETFLVSCYKSTRRAIMESKNMCGRKTCVKFNWHRI